MSNNLIKPQHNKRELLPWVSLSHFHVYGNHQEIFFKQTRSTISHLENNSQLKPIYKKGVDFFNAGDNGLFISPDIKTQKSQWETELKGINEEKRRLKRLLRKDPGASYQTQIDS